MYTSNFQFKVHKNTSLVFAAAEMIADSAPSLSPVPTASFFSLLLYKQLKSHAFFLLIPPCPQENNFPSYFLSQPNS